MFTRVSYEVSAAGFTLIAFLSALAIYVVIAVRAVRMKPGEVSRFCNLPFETETPSARDGNTPKTDTTP